MNPNLDLINVDNFIPIDEKCEFKPSTIDLMSVCDVPSISIEVIGADDFLDVISFNVFQSTLDFPLLLLLFIQMHDLFTGIARI
jgi:hypothetical protein